MNKKIFVPDNLKLGDQLLVDLVYKSNYWDINFKGKRAELVDINMGNHGLSYLLSFADWNDGHKGLTGQYDGCQENQCIWVTTTPYDVIKYLKIIPISDLPDITHITYDDLFGTLNESSNVEEIFISDGLKVGDRVLVDLIYSDGDDWNISLKSKYATVVDIEIKKKGQEYLLAFEDWNAGHDGLLNRSFPQCHSYNCFWVAKWYGDVLKKLKVLNVTDLPDISDIQYDDLFGPIIESTNFDNLEVHSDTEKLKKGDKIIISFYCENPPREVENAFAEVLLRDGEWVLISIKDWHRGHFFPSDKLIGNKCLEDNCWYIKSGSEFFKKLEWLLLPPKEKINYDDLFGPITESNAEKFLPIDGAQVGDKFVAEINCGGEILPPKILEIIAIRDFDNGYEVKYLMAANEDVPCFHDGNLMDSEDYLSDICRNRRCWWAYSSDDKSSMYKFHRIEKIPLQSLNYDDLFGPLNESRQKRLQVSDGLKVGDRVLVDLVYANDDFDFNIKSKFAKILVLEEKEGYMRYLLAFEDWHDGHNGIIVKHPECGSDKCFWLSELYPNLISGKIQSLKEFPDVTEILANL